MNRSGWLFLFVVSLAPAIAAAKDTGFEFGARVGYGVPMGEMNGDTDFDEAVESQIPLWLDLGARASPNVFVGAYMSYGFTEVGNELRNVCDATNTACSASTLRLGGQLQYQFAPKAKAGGWFGVGIGWERLAYDISGGGEEVTLSSSGTEFFMLQVGVDFKAGESVALGPFLALTHSQFSSVDCDGSVDICDGTVNQIEHKAFHQWLVFGFRGVFGPF